MSVTFDAVNTGVAFTSPRLVTGMTFQGSGLTAGQRVTVRNRGTVGTGSMLADYLTAATLDNADLWAGRVAQAVRGLSVDNGTVAGTWALTVFLGDGCE